ncbi:conserved Plasmodium protein, unknown function [Plasmodium gallinaceum]|uniref:Ubiquitin-like domain-containing protein n=1 Tax=Plasmodium gallinaceum TaxID=5849 RepID=A0A1J1GUZ0_PLAGA|nr:conserved Plasmodium protein, unknown function [Plasmodium gallinaceum]CRG96301.1 conserved Plasmodium protein, unknown function [Plasmodium gallinaceum]
MVTKLIKFIILRPRGIPQNLELEINCNEIIKNLKQKLFPEDIKKDLNVRLIYMGKILDDKKKLEDYLNFYQKELLINNKKDNYFINEKKNENQNEINKDINNQNISRSYKENIPITIHVKITEKSTSAKNANNEGKGINTSLAQISLVAFVLLLWLYRYNYSSIFPLFSTTVLFLFTILIMTIIFHSYLVLFFNIAFKVITTIYQIIKYYFVRIYTYIIQKKEKLCIKKKLKNDENDEKNLKES